MDLFIKDEKSKLNSEQISGEQRPQDVKNYWSCGIDSFFFFQDAIPFKLIKKS
jgi:hypothetical protein